MLRKYFIVVFLVVTSIQVSNTMYAQSNQTVKIDTTLVDSLKFTIGKVVLNQSLWSQPYRYDTKDLKTLSIQITVERISKEDREVDYNLFSLLVASKEIRIRPTGLFYYKSSDKKKYLRSQPVNRNYDVFRDYSFEGFENYEIKTFDPNFFGKIKKGRVPTVKELKKIKLKKRKLTYHLDFPSYSKFTQGKLYYKGKAIGIVHVKK